MSLFFTDGEVQRQGIGWELWRRASERCLANQPETAKITVHSSPNAFEAYRKFGFQAEGREQTENGIRFVPMAFAVQTSVGSQGTCKQSNHWGFCALN